MVSLPATRSTDPYRTIGSFTHQFLLEIELHKMANVRSV
jgi:hypothetical protein